MEMFQRLLAQLRAYWAGLSTTRRVMIVGASGMVFAALAGLTYLNRPAGYVPLYPGEPMSNEDKATIIASLTKLNLKYELDSVHGITVPADRALYYQVSLAGEGIPVRGSGKGFELFDDSNSLTSTPFKDQVTYQRAMQAELSRTISQFAGVKSARVQIAKPEQTYFERPQSPAKASVYLTLKTKEAFGRKQADSVVALVSNAVERLKPENVVVVADGMIVSDPHAAERDQLPTGQMEHLRSIEADLAKKAEDILARHLGRDRVAVKVTADVDFRKIRELEDRVLPDSKTPEREMQKTSNTTNSPPGGVAGARSNTPPASSGGRGGGTSKEELTQTDYVISKKRLESEDRNIAIKRLSVAAMVDLTPRPAAEGETPPPVMTVKEVEEVIKSAIGYSDGRGDKITVAANKFASDGLPVPEPDDEAAKLQRFSAYVSLTRNICLAVAVVMALLLIPLLLLRRRAKVVPKPADTAAVAVTPSLEQKRQQLIDRLVDLTRSDPDRAARVFGLLVGSNAG
jgi:flagellar M-ring protein FliF